MSGFVTREYARYAGRPGRRVDNGPVPGRRVGWLLVAVAIVATGCATPRDRTAVPAAPTSSQPTTATTATRTPTPTTGSTSAPAASAPCGWRSAPPVHYDHVLWVILENHSYEDLIGQPGSRVARRSPYLNRVARACGTATRYYGVTHPSLPNYLALVSGRTGGVTTDCQPADCPQHRDTVFQQLLRAHLDWRVYAEAMPGTCRRSNHSTYVVKHNPPAYFPDMAADCAARDVPMGSTGGGRLVSDLAANRLPSFAIVVPDNCHNTHDCSVATGDRWLARLLPKVLASPGYRAGRTAVVITWDEGAGSQRGEDCAATSDRGCHVAAVVISPSTRPGTRAGVRLDHYALLGATEQMLGVGPLLGHAGDNRGAAAANLRTAFRL